MKIETLVNFKMSDNTVWKKGRYDDTDKPFPDELYEEIDKHMENRVKKKKLIVIDDGNITKQKQEELEEEVNTLDTGEDVIETTEKAPEKSKAKPKTRKRKTKSSK